MVFQSSFRNLSDGGGYGWDEDYEDFEDVDDGNEEEEEEEEEAEEEPEAKGLKAAALAERKKRKAAEAQVATLKAEAAAAKTAAREAEGDTLALYTESKTALAAAQERVAKLEEKEAARLDKLTERNEKALAELPEDFRDLVPDGLDADSTATQIARLAKLAAAEGDKRPTGSRRSSGKGPKQKVPAECKEAAIAQRMDPDEFFPIWLRTKKGKEWASKQT